MEDWDEGCRRRTNLQIRKLILSESRSSFEAAIMATARRVSQRDGQNMLRCQQVGVLGRPVGAEGRERRARDGGEGSDDAKHGRKSMLKGGLVDACFQARSVLGHTPLRALGRAPASGRTGPQGHRLGPPTGFVYPLLMDTLGM